MSNDDGESDDGLLGNPERFESSLGPSTPEVDVPEAPDPRPESADMGEADPEVARTFWKLVIMLDVAFLGMALGPMFVFFEGDWNTGLPLFALGVVAFAYAVFQYRQYRSDDES